MYCTHCGAQLAEEAVVCPACGCATENHAKQQAAAKANASDVLKKVAKILMIVFCAIEGVYLIPLCWMLPMTLHYIKCVDEGIPVSLAFKICTILFASLPAGVLMVVADEV